MTLNESRKVVVVGAGVGGLTAAAALARRGFDVTILEAHIYPGGCAGTFYHQGYCFDAGATLAGGFFPGGPMDLVASAVGISRWPVSASPEALIVHLPALQDSGPTSVVRCAGDERWEVYRRAFGRQSEAFWRWQETTADALWDLALLLPDWPPQSPAQLLHLLRTGMGWLGGTRWAFPDLVKRLSGMLADALRPVAVHLKSAPEKLRLFVDAQLLISAQTTSPYANALYGAAALDLPRRGVVSPSGGMGTIAQTIAEACVENGGRINYRNEVTKIRMEGKKRVVVTRRGEEYPADIIIANLPPPNVAKLAGEAIARRLGVRARAPQDGWGAFVLYIGLDGKVVPHRTALHHQVIALGEPHGKTPLGEGNSVFVSISPEWDTHRAPAGRRAITLSTHTSLGAWQKELENDPRAYEARQALYIERLLQAGEIAIPGLRQGASLILPGTPVTFERFTRRLDGWVGGFPQTSLVRTLGPKLAEGLWIVGDSIFPGQSVPAVALGGLRVARAIASDYTKSLSGA